VIQTQFHVTKSDLKRKILPEKKKKDEPTFYKLIFTREKEGLCFSGLLP